MNTGNTWALVLAAGEGSRLRSLTTTPGGLSVPKQFCSLQGGASLLEEALSRALSVAKGRHILAVVAAHHRRWWASLLGALPPANIIVQPDNRGTAIGLLLPLLHIVERDPYGTVIVLPSDHFFRGEAVLVRSLKHASRLAKLDLDHVHLLGVKPEEVELDLGYIVPGDCTSGCDIPVRRFVEKPAVNMARDLIEAGALWNVFIVAASAHALLRLYADRHPGLVARMRTSIERDRSGANDGSAVKHLYRTLQTLDFSRDVLQGREQALRVLPVPACGWSDLGTPRRVAAALSRYAGPRKSPWRPQHTGYLSLADQHAQQQHMNCGMTS